MEVQEIIKQ